MIISTILTILYYVIFGLVYPIRFLPDVSLPSDITSAITTAGGYLYAFDSIIPTTPILTIIGLFLTIEGFILLFKVINWLIRKIPTIN